MKTAIWILIVAGVVIGLWYSSAQGRITLGYGVKIIDAVGSFTSFNILPSDLNGDQVVNSQDLQTLLEAMNSTAGGLRFDIRADLEGNGRVDSQDVRLFMQNKECWVGSPKWDANVDFDADGKIDWRDLSFVANNYVTNPATLSLLVFGHLPLLHRKS